MTLQKHLGAGLLAVLVLTIFPFGTINASENIAFKNETAFGVTALYCTNGREKSLQLTGETAAGASVSFPANPLTDEDACPRLYVTMNTGASWQFYRGYADLLLPEKITLKMTPYLPPDDIAKPEDAKNFPTMVLEAKEETLAIPTGMLMSYLAEDLGYGMDEQHWKDNSPPGSEISKNPGEFTLNFVGISWLLTDEAFTYTEVTPGSGLWVMVSVTFMAPFAPETPYAIFNQLQDLVNAFPWQIEYKGKREALSIDAEEIETGLPLKNFALIGDTWEYIAKILDEATSSGDNVILVFGSNNLLFTLNLDMKSFEATLTIKRKADAAWG